MAILDSHLVFLLVGVEALGSRIFSNAQRHCVDLLLLRHRNRLVAFLHSLQFAFMLPVVDTVEVVVAKLP